MESLRPIKTHLFTPGPTAAPDAVLRAMSAPLVHHRTQQWQEVFTEVLAQLPKLFGTEHDIAVFTSSGTGAMESAVANLVEPGDEVVVASFGRFGERWVDIAERYGAVVHHHQTEWGTRPDAGKIARFVGEHSGAKVVFTTHSETSTGAVSDAGAIAAAVREHAGDRVALVLDAISSLGAVPVQADDWGYDVVVAGSQKALMLPPGLAFASVSPRALERARSIATRTLYFDWPKTLDAQRKQPASTAFTPALTLVIGLRVALEMLLDEGADAVYERHVGLGRAARAAVKALGLELFGPDDDSSAILTAVKVPEGVDGTRIPKQLREYGVTIAGGQADLKGRIFRLGHTGYVNAFDLVVCIAALERGLAELGVDVPVGAGVAAAQRSLTPAPARA